MGVRWQRLGGSGRRFSLCESSKDSQLPGEPGRWDADGREDEQMREDAVETALSHGGSRGVGEEEEKKGKKKKKRH